MKKSLCRISGLIRGAEFETRMVMANNRAGVLYEVAKAGGGLFVHTAACAPGQ